MVKEVLNMFKTFNSESSSATRGLNMALGVLSDTLLSNKELGIANMLFETLMSNCVPKQSDTDDAESRRQAVKSLGQVITSCGMANLDSSIIV